MPVSPPLSTLDNDPCDIFLPLPARIAPGRPPGCVLPLSDLVGTVPGLVFEDTDETRVVREAGTGGGPMDGLVGPEGGRALGGGLVALDGVPVRDVAALEVAVPNCLVGDFVGDWVGKRVLAYDILGRRGRLRYEVADGLTLMTLEGRDKGLGTGLGLGAFRLIRLFKPASMLPERAAPEVTMLLGRESGLLATGCFGGGGGGWARTVTVVGRTNMPKPIRQSK